MPNIKVKLFDNDHKFLALFTLNLTCNSDMPKLTIIFHEGSTGRP